MIETQIRAFMSELLTTWQSRDLAGYLSHLSPEIDLVNRGGRWLRGMDAATGQLEWLMASGLETIFTAKHTVEAIRPLGGDLVLLHERRIEPERESIAVYLLAHCDDHWMVESITIAPVQTQPH
jgi:hypothetical protein